MTRVPQLISEQTSRDVFEIQNRYLIMIHKMMINIIININKAFP